LTTIFDRLGVDQPLFFKIWADLADAGRVPGKIVGGRGSLRSLYVPALHEKAVREFVRKKLAEEHFIGLFFSISTQNSIKN
jgi:hypothetical protein